ncbi:MAG: hypothetical protein U0228_30985 [Myxococcaceae bacterium]
MQRRAVLISIVVLLVAAVAWWLLGASSGEGTTESDSRGANSGPSRPTPAPEPERPPPPRTTTVADDESLGSGGVASTTVSFDAGTLDPNDRDAGRAFLDALARAQLARALKDNATTAAKNVDAYCAATKDLVAEQDKRTFKNDAALFLADRTDWESGKIGLLHLPASLTQRMGNPPGAWRRMGPEAYAGLDFGWMKEALAFDHWSMMTAGPLHDQQQNSFADAPIPNFVVLQTWVKLRLLKGLHEGDLASASVEVRHLAELCGTTGSLVGDMIRVAMLGIERGFYEEHQLDTAPAMTQPEAQRLRAASFAAIEFLLPGVDAATRAKALKCLPNRCTAMVEATGLTASMRELDPSVGEHLQWLTSQPQCDPALSAMSARSNPAPAGELATNPLFTQLDDHLRTLLDGGVQ